MRPSAPLLAGALLLAAGLSVAPSSPAWADVTPPPAQGDLEAQAKAIEVQLIAPCCKNQTLDVHSSPVVDQMKKEIRERLAAGDPPEAILKTFEERYGPEVRAISSPRSVNHLGAGLAAVGLAGAVFAGSVLLRWRRRAAASAGARAGGAAPVSAAPGGEAISDERLDRELEALDRA